jgi:hypothetical protein
MERIVDKVLLLRLIRAAQGRGRLVTIPLHKLVFLSEHQMNGKRIKGFNYSFYRDRFGPAAPGIYDDFGELIDAGLIRDCPFRLTSSGEELLDGLEPAFRRNGNRLFSGIIGEIAKDTPLDIRPIKELVYKMSITLPDGTVKKVSEIPFRPNRKILMMRKLSAGDFREAFTLEEGEVETFEMMMDPELRDSLRRAEDDARGGRISPRTPV